MKISRQHLSRQTCHSIRFKMYSVVCLSIVLFYLVRPLLPFVEYAVNREYISQNLCINRDKPRNCCHGKCYLEEQLKRTAETPDSNTNNNKKIVSDQRMEDHLRADEIFISTVVKGIKMRCHFPSQVIVMALSPFFVPPKF